MRLERHWSCDLSDLCVLYLGMDYTVIIFRLFALIDFDVMHCP
jgi:hypothetical protein